MTTANLHFTGASDWLSGKDNSKCFNHCITKQFVVYSAVLLIFIWVGYSFVLGDKLPLIYDAAIDIYSVSKGPRTIKRKEAINAYCCALRSVWTKSFGENHVMSRNSCKKNLNHFE